MFPAGTYNGRVPGPTLRVTEGDRVRVRFENRGSHPHTIHFHGIHSARMDGVPGAGDALPGGEFIYEFDAFRSEEHTSELQSLMRISYAVFCLNKTTPPTTTPPPPPPPPPTPPPHPPPPPPP